VYFGKTSCTAGTRMARRKKVGSLLTLYGCSSVAIISSSFSDGEALSRCLGRAASKHKVQYRVEQGEYQGLHEVGTRNEKAPAGTGPRRSPAA
jgi:hypothetical protein